jgi:hypothetical protein
MTRPEAIAEALHYSLVLLPGWLSLAWVLWMAVRPKRINRRIK